jgi:photosystem II stability/assembly factor-like uncharacterized protein
MKMITPEVGWAVTGGKLWWTADQGAHWSNITPKPFANAGSISEQEGFDGQPETFASIFFLDTQRGWVLLCCGERDPNKPRNGFPEFHLAATTDAGRTWSIARVKIPHGIQPRMDSYSGQIEFADPTHGWMMLTQSSVQAADARGGGQQVVVSSVLLTTSDGGTRWRRAPAEPPGQGGLFYLVSPDEGWQFTLPWWDENNRYGYGLSVTRDGGRTWHDVSVPFPKELLGTAIGDPPPTPYYCDLTFDRRNLRHGFLAVIYRPIYRPRSNSRSTLVLLETYDGGRSSWKPIRTINDLPNGGNDVIVDVVDSVLIAAAESHKDQTVTLWRDGPDGKFETDISKYFRGVAQLSFVSAKQGWIRTSKLFATTDGGTAWTELAPEPHVDTSLDRPYQGRFPIGAMQLLTSDVGWALSLTYGNLLWTRDGGKTWSDITPSTAAFGSHPLVSAFFLNDKQGWALARDACVFSTADAGAHWSMTQLSGVEEFEHIPERRVSINGRIVVLLAGKLKAQLVGQISFSDSLHGWASLAPVLAERTEQRWLLMTSDGGRTWQHAPADPGYAGIVSAVTAEQCWFRSFSGDALSVTRDVGKSWDNVLLPAPKGVEPDSTRTYDLPIFKDHEHGFLSVTYCAAPRAQSAAVLFATDDGGRTWKTDRMLTNLDKIAPSRHVSSTMVGNSWIITNVIDHLSPTLTAISAGSTVASTSNAQPGYYGYDQLSFLSLSRGWINSDGFLLNATSDGGATWTNITPKPPPLPFPRLRTGPIIHPRPLPLGFVRAP